MRSHYDFSKGVRNKHAARLARQWVKKNGGWWCAATAATRGRRYHALAKGGGAVCGFRPKKGWAVMRFVGMPTGLGCCPKCLGIMDWRADARGAVDAPKYTKRNA